jgi:hypothetical protein
MANLFLQCNLLFCVSWIANYIWVIHFAFIDFGGLGMWECSLKSNVVVSIAYPIAYIMADQI